MASKQKKAAKRDKNPAKPAQKKAAGGVTTIYSLHIETGADRHSMKRWFAAENIDPAKDPQAARDCIARHRTPQRKPLAHNGGPPIMAANGNPWQVEKMRQETMKLERENEIAEKAALREWMPVRVHEQILTELGNKLNRVPGKIASTYGLSDVIKTGMQKELDEARQDAAEAIGKNEFEASAESGVQNVELKTKEST